VTDAQVRARAHAMFDAFRADRHVSQSDEQIMREFHVPRDIFLEDVRFREQADRLAADFTAAEVAKRNGHPVQPSDWLELRQLFLDVKPTTDLAESEQRFAAGRKTIDGWRAEIRAGKPMDQVARERNSDDTREKGGMRGACLRGTGTPAVEQAIVALKPGELSEPIRGRTGWYVFRIERVGDQIPADERDRAWKTVVESRRQAFLADLLRHAHITSTIPLNGGRP